LGVLTIARSAPKGPARYVWVKVSHLLEEKGPVYIPNTGHDHPRRHWFKKGGFQEREGIVSLSAHVLSWNGEIVGVMFCNYRRQTEVEMMKELSERAAVHAALVLHQERSSAQSTSPSEPPPAHGLG